MNAKQQVKEILEHLPDDCSIEDVQYHLYVVDRIKRRLEMADGSEFVPQSEVEERLAKWLIR